MDFTKQSAIDVLQKIDKSPTEIKAWRDLIMICFDQKDSTTIQTLQVVVEAIEKLWESRKVKAREEFDAAVRRFRESGQQGKGQLPDPVVKHLYLTDTQRQAFIKVSMNPNEPLPLEKLGLVYLDEFNLPEIAHKLFERALCFDPSDEDLVKVLAKAVDSMTRNAPNTPQTDEEAANEIFGIASNQPKKRLRLSSILQARKTLEKESKAEAPIKSFPADALPTREPTPLTAPPINAEQWFQRSQEFATEGSWDQAWQACEKAVEHQPDPAHSINAYTQLGASAFQAGQWDQAIKAFTKAHEADSTNFEICFNLALAHQQQGELDEALGYYLKARQIDARHPKLLSNLGALYHKMGEFKSAEECLRESVAADPAYARAWDNLASTYAAQDKWQEAFDACRQAVQLRPNSPEPWYRLGLLAFQHEDLAEAANAFEQVIKFQPDSAPAALYLATIYARTGRLDEAQTLATTGAAGDPTSELAWNAWNEIGTASYETGNFEQAVTAYQQAAAIRPEESETWFDLGVVFQKQTRIAEARDSFRRAVELKDDYITAWHNLAVASKMLGEMDESEKAFAKARSITPGEVAVWHEIGVELGSGGNVDEALEALEKAMALQPNLDALWAESQGSPKADNGDIAGLEPFRKSVEATPDSWEAWFALGVACDAHDQPEQSITAFRKTVELNPACTEAWEFLLQDYERLGRQEDITALRAQRPFSR